MMGDVYSGLAGMIFLRVMSVNEDWRSALQKDVDTAFR